VDVQEEMALDSQEVIVRMVASGLGVAVGADQLQFTAASGSVVELCDRVTVNSVPLGTFCFTSTETPVVPDPVQDLIDQGIIKVGHELESRNRHQTRALLDAIKDGGFDAVFGGGRRDEDKARAKERVLSFRDKFGQWDPKNQRPELWRLYNGRHRKGEHIRVFPISDWTELDVWRYLSREQIELPPIYFAHEREVVDHDGLLMAVNEYFPLPDGATPKMEMVRYRTVGDATLTGAVPSQATDYQSVIEETAISRITERGATRGDDRFSEAAMEDRKREGYF